MPTWLINIIVTLAVKVGLPWVVQKFPKMPQEIIDIISQLLEQLKNPTVSNSVAKKQALTRVKEFCTAGCEATTKKD